MYYFILFHIISYYFILSSSSSRIPVNAPSYQFIKHYHHHQWLLNLHNLLKAYLPQGASPFIQTFELSMPSLFTLLLRTAFIGNSGTSQIALTFAPAYGIYITGTPFDLPLMAPFLRQLYLANLLKTSAKDYIPYIMFLLAHQYIVFGVRRKLEEEHLMGKDKLIFFSLGVYRLEIHLYTKEPLLLAVSPRPKAVKIQAKDKYTTQFLKK